LPIITDYYYNYTCHIIQQQIPTTNTCKNFRFSGLRKALWQYFRNNISLQSNLQTSQQRQPHTIQIVRAHTGDLTMAAASRAFGPDRAVPGIMELILMWLRLCEASFNLVLLNVGRTTRPMLGKILKLFYANIYRNYNGDLNGRSQGVYMKHQIIYHDVKSQDFERLK